MNLTEKDNRDNCPTCGRLYELRCRCMRGDMVCENGHHWHTCFVHKNTVLGESDHGKPINECTCGKPIDNSLDNL